MSARLIRLTLAAVVVLVIAYKFYSSFYDEQQKIQFRLQAAVEQFQDSLYDNNLQACSKEPPPDLATCLASAELAKKSFERDERNAAAQDKTALWTFATAITAIVGMSATLFGAILVWFTWHETQQATERQFRAHLGVLSSGNLTVTPTAVERATADGSGSPHLTFKARLT